MHKYSRQFSFLFQSLPHYCLPLEPHRYCIMQSGDTLPSFYPKKTPKKPKKTKRKPPLSVTLQCTVYMTATLIQQIIKPFVSFWVTLYTEPVLG